MQIACSFRGFNPVSNVFVLCKANFRWFAQLFMAIVRAAKAGSTHSLLKRFEVLKLLAAKVLPEYRFKWPQMTWWHSENFNIYLDRFKERGGNNTDRRWLVSQLLRLIEDVPGDTVEVGCYRGAMSWLICESNQQGTKRKMRVHHIFDSFEGLSEPGLDDGVHWQKGALACSEAMVHANLAPFAGKFWTYKGWIPERFSEVADFSFAFVHIDVDLHDPTMESLEFFYPRLSLGGILICDDYGFSSCLGATLACDRYLADKPEAMVQLPDGGGFLIKGVTTAANAY